MPADILSDALSVLSPATHVAGAFDLGGEWAIAFPAHEGLKFFAVVAGRAWLRVEGDGDAILLSANDCVILPAGRGFVIARDMSFTPIGIETIAATDWHQRVAIVGGGNDTMLLGGHFAFTGIEMDLLLGSKPPILRLRDEAGQHHMRWALERIIDELSAAGPGSVAVVRHIGHLLLVQALRLYIVAGAECTTGWLFALGDPRIGRAAQAIHGKPSGPWTVTRLATVAGMSRSKFSERFRAITGVSPIAYMTHWRMLLACKQLSAGRETVGQIAIALGYASEASFSTAFKRVMGCSPRKYGNSAGRGQ